MIRHCHGDRTVGAPQREDGFSLIEMLIALVLIAAALAMLPGAFRTAQRMVNSETAMQDQARIGATRAYLERVLAGAMPIMMRRASGQIGVAFWGGADSIRFVAAAASGPGGGGLYQHALQIEPSATTSTGDVRQALVLRMSAYPLPPGQEGVVDYQRILLSGASGLRMRYFGAGSAGGERMWLDGWTRPDSLPELIELTLAPAGSGAAGSIPLVVRPQLGPPG